MGIRLPKEDEIEGLDVTGRFELLIALSVHGDIRLIVAHGERWQVAASNAFNELIRKVVEEHHKAADQLQGKGTLALQYIPADADQQAFSVPISTPSTTRADHASYSNETNKQRRKSRTDIFHF